MAQGLLRQAGKNRILVSPPMTWLKHAPPDYSLTCTTCAGAKPLNQVDEALLYAPIRSE